jgi:nitrous oxidase accessory protein
MLNKLLPIIIALFTVEAHAGTLRIKANSSNQSIHEAIEQSAAGDTIILQAGFYKEHGLIVDKPLHIIGEGEVTIDGEHVESIIKFTTNHFSLEGIKVINVGKSYIKDYAAIYVSHCDSFKIVNNTFEHVFFGLLI